MWLSVHFYLTTWRFFYTISRNAKALLSTRIARGIIKRPNRHLIKDHPFVDGCKRIGASIFLEFLNKNKHLIIDGKQIISDSALVAITLMIAESRPEEKETMVKLVMNFLKM